MAKVTFQIGFRLPYRQRYAMFDIQCGVELEGDDPEELARQAEEFVYRELNRQLDEVSKRGPNVDGYDVSPSVRSAGPKRKRSD